MDIASPQPKPSTQLAIVRSPNFWKGKGPPTLGAPSFSLPLAATRHVVLMHRAWLTYYIAAVIILLPLLVLVHLVTEFEDMLIMLQG